MRTEKIKNHLRVILDPGDYYTSNVPVTISTLLGSCVAACLFDPFNKVMGMNHFMLSHKRYSRDMPMTESEAGRYGINSMELLINAMLKIGAEKRFVKAKVFGGSSMINGDSDTSNFNCVGEVNSRFIREFLTFEKIPLLAENLGGKEGRVIHFSYGDFAVYMRWLKSADRSKSLVMRDRACWLHALAEQEKQAGGMSNVELWD
jgi:chemotaxis protein CheD